METEQPRHETEENLILAQFEKSHSISGKLQNGHPSSKENSFHLTADTNWSSYKTSTSINSIKRNRENCSSPASGQGLHSFTMNGELVNGELKNAFTDESFLTNHPKKLRADPLLPGRDENGMSELDNCPEMTKETAFRENAEHADILLDKPNYIFPNGDIYHSSRNKTIPAPNRAVPATSTIESTPGDLLEKTLSQYYPEQVSIAPQTSGSQIDAVNGSVINRLPNEGAQPHSLTSGPHSSATIPNSQQKQSGVSVKDDKGIHYNSDNCVVNGYSDNYGATNHQQQRHQPPPSYPSQDPTPQSQNISKDSHQNGNGPQFFSGDINVLGICDGASRGFEHPFPDLSVPQQSAAGGRGPFPQSINKVHSDELGSLPHQGNSIGLQYQMQQNPGNPHLTAGVDLPSFQKQQYVGLDTGTATTSQRVNAMYSNSEQAEWKEPGPFQYKQRTDVGFSNQTQGQNTWRNYHANPESKQQSPNPHTQGQKLTENLPKSYTSDGSFLTNNQGSNSHKQQQEESFPGQSHFASRNNSIPDWQRTNSKTPQTNHQSLSEQCAIPPNQQVNAKYHNHTPPQHLSDPDLQDLLTSEFLANNQQQHCQPQRPLSNPPHFKEQQIKSPNYRPHSQPQPGHPQPQQNQPLRKNPAQDNNQHVPRIDFNTNTYNETKVQLHQGQFSSNSGINNLQQVQPQRPNHYHPLSHTDAPESSSGTHSSQLSINQQLPIQRYPKAEQQLESSCSQFQMGPRLPLGTAGPHGDLQRHAALRMHLLQKQERHILSQQSQSVVDPRYGLKAIKTENGPRFDSPSSELHEKQMRMQASGIQVKQESQQSMCQQSKPNSILASMEQSLRQYQLSPMFEKKSIVINSSNKVKVESSGPVTIISTNTDLCKTEPLPSAPAPVAQRKPPNSTPKKDALLQSFIDSPMKLLDTPIKNLLDTPLKTQYEIASCHCVEQLSEKDEGPYYTHLGSAPSVADIRKLMENRSGLSGRSIRIEKVVYTGKEGKSTQGCPIAKWVIRRSSVEEKLLVLVRERNGHTCDTACIIVVILVWEGIQPSLADRLYLELSDTLTKHGAHTQRRCAHNEERTCACQGLNPEASGASFSFGCSWSMYYNGCKFARSKIPRKFKLLGDDMREEERLEHNFQNLATLLGPLYKTMAPEAYGNQVEHEHRAPDCRLGLKEGRPFSGVTACMDFCAHAHRDLHNMQGGSTVVCTLTSQDNREIGKIPDDEQLHVLPLYKASNTDEFGSEEGQLEKVKSGAIQVLSAFRRQVRMLAEPAKSCRQKKLESKKAAANKNAALESAIDKAEKAKSKVAPHENPATTVPVAGHIPGAVGATLQPGQPTRPIGAHPQHLQQQHGGVLPSYTGAPNAANYPRFLNQQGPFPSTSKPGAIYSHPTSAPASAYPSPLHAPNAYLNGSNNSYPGYQYNGGMPVDKFHPYYGANSKPIDMYQQQQPALYAEQQFGVNQRYDGNYPPRYGELGMQVNGYNACNMRPVHPMRPFSQYGPNGSPDPRFMGPLARGPPTHEGLDYIAANNNQLGGYPNAYLSQNSQTLPPGQDPFQKQIKTEMGMSGPQMSGGPLHLEPHKGLAQSNGTLMGTCIKQEPGTPQTPTTPQKPEMWSDNEHNFLDPDIGGVAVAPSHGSVLIECAKKELHATTPLKNPDRNHPTRISLVFYQHKNLNEAKHGLALWEAKMAEKAREKEEDLERNGGEATPSKSSKKGAKREHQETSVNIGEPPYKRFIQALMEGSLSCTTNSYVSSSPYAFTKVTGPYSKFA
ncbi:methylcytosine dioxygenase TET2 [Synchiropus splendidus]|uniref:methylcytosine dioxygenase TET2 n=1 Tax=Synchiropus splendidus TaxID=270530 RepID=UPI00237DACF2|nr:methylcytosine dioxygenase TET2 [Synchiropus splendidus]